MAVGMVISTGIRAPVQGIDPAHRISAHISGFINGILNPLSSVVPSMLSAVWFPLNERNLATTLATQAIHMGTCLSFLLGPSIVHTSISDVDTNSTDEDAVVVLPPDQKQDITSRISIYLYIQLGLCILLLILTVIYYPNKPPKPPSVSTTVDRLGTCASVKRILSEKGMWPLIIGFSFSTGAHTAWVSMMDELVHPHSISEYNAGWMGFSYSLIGLLASIVCSLILDHNRGKEKISLKIAIVTLYIIAAVMFVIMICVLLVQSQAPVVLLYITIVIGQACISASIPIIYEIMCENAYPASECSSVGVLEEGQAIISAVLLLIMMIPKLGTMWLHVTLLIGIVIGLVCYMISKEDDTRTIIDTSKEDIKTKDLGAVDDSISTS